MKSRIALLFAFVASMVVWAMPQVANASACSPSQTSVGTDDVVTFTNTTLCQWTVPTNVTTVRVLLIGGGGGGGFDIGGGGGAGGFREVNSVAVTAGEVVNVVAGAGGSGDMAQGLPCVGTNGQDSSIGFSSGSLVALGGGGGGGQNGGGACATDGMPGASGGGGGVGLQWPRVGGTGSYATDGDNTTFGNDGGNTPTSGGYYAGGGGGGAGGVGGNGSSDSNGSIGGAGGAGKTSTITGASVVYAGGGAGGFFQSGTRGIGGTGGGGNGGTNSVAPTAGTDGLGGGGGGGGVQSGALGQGGRGANGVVIVRYSTVVPTTTAAPTTTAPSTTTTSSTTSSTTTTTTAAPVLQIVINNPATTIPPSSSSTIATVSSVVAVQSQNSSTTTSTPRSLGIATTTTSTPMQSTSTTTSVPSIPTVETGQAAVSIGDTNAKSTLERQNNQIVISVGDLKATVAAVEDNGNVAPLDSDGNIALHPGDKIAIKLGGFPAGTPVEMWMFSTPTRIGTATVNAKGELNTTVLIPKEVPVGSHRIAITTKPKDGEPVTFTLGVSVRKYTKESRMVTWLIVTPIVLAMLSALFLPPALRKRRKKIV